MAITRCPYCHAIIDETDKYCNNCGTQLLFPDEDAIEEEIPGEKIIDADTEEKDYEIGEPGKTSSREFVDEDERETESLDVKTADLDEALKGEPPDRDIRELIEEEEPREEAGEEDRLEDVILVDEIAAQEAGKPDYVDEEEELVVAPEARTPTTAVIGEPEAPETGAVEAVAIEPPAPETPAEPAAPEAAPRAEEAPPKKEEETKAYLINPVPLDEHELEPDDDETPAALPGDEETAEIVGDETVVPAVEAEAVPAAEEPAAYEAPDESEAEVVCEKPVEEERTEELPAAEPKAEAAPAEPEPVREPTPATWHEPTPPPMREMEPEPEEATAEGEPAAAEPPSKPVTFDTRELEGIGKTIDLSKARLDSLIEEMVEDQEIEENLKPVRKIAPSPPPARAPDREPMAEDQAEAVREPEPRREAEAEPVPAAAPLPEEEPPPALETEPLREQDVHEEEPAQEAEPTPKTGTLPPWASRMKGRPTIPDTGETGQELSPFEEAKKSLGAIGPTPGLPEAAPPKEATPDAEEEIFPHRKMPDSGIGLPERITQATLPFGKTEAAEEEESARPLDKEAEEPLGTTEFGTTDLAPADLGTEAAAETAGEWAEEPAREPEPEAPLRPPVPPVPPPPPREIISPRVQAPAAEEAEEAEEEEPKPPFSLSQFVKSKGFDLLLVGIFWLVALWVAARSLGSTFFEMLNASPGALAGLYGVLVVLYFFLFKFFLGETLGDRLFREREPADE